MMSTQSTTTTANASQRIADQYCSDPAKACRAALRATRNEPENSRLEAINALLGLHGTEAIEGDWQNGYWCNIVAAYCNTGDTYGTTVIQVRGASRFSSSRFIVSTVGDFVESNARKLGIR